MKPAPLMFTVKEWAASHGKTCTAARRMLHAKPCRVKGAQLAGIHWLVPAGTPWPQLMKVGRPKGSARKIESID